MTAYQVQSNACIYLAANSASILTESCGPVRPGKPQPIVLFKMQYCPPISLALQHLLKIVGGVKCQQVFADSFLSVSRIMIGPEAEVDMFAASEFDST